jgi:ABC-type branched-subunit amino acid transport system substrate-binding protein
LFNGTEVKMRPISLTSTLAAAVAAVWAMSVAGAEAQEPIKVGFAGALSGAASFVGVEIKRGAEINAKGGVKGHKLVLVSHDDEHIR